MKQKTFLGFALVAIAFALGGVSQPSFGQAGAGTDDPLLGAALTELVAQQTAVVENQAKIEAKLALIAEDVRIARIYVGRGGGKAVAK